MKLKNKPLGSLLLIFVALSFSVLFTSCKKADGERPILTENLPKQETPLNGTTHPISEIGKTIEETGSYKLTTTINSPLLNLFPVTVLVDGNIQYTEKTSASEEEYLEIAERGEYTYTKDNEGKWVKKLTKVYTEQDKLNDDDEFFELFNPDNYDKISEQKEEYKQKSNVSFSEYEDVELTITKNGCKLTMKVKSEGYSITMKFEQIGKVELELPVTD